MKRPLFVLAKGWGPRHVHFYPNSRWLYADNEQGNSVTMFAFDDNTGTLVSRQTMSTLPSGLSKGACARMLIHPNGRFPYAANRGHDSLACLRIDESSGALASCGHYPTPANPRSFDIHPNGFHLYVAGESADQLIHYRCDENTGVLAEAVRFTTGTVPWWVNIENVGECA